MREALEIQSTTQKLVAQALHAEKTEKITILETKLETEKQFREFAHNKSLANEKERQTIDLQIQMLKAQIKEKNEKYLQLENNVEGFEKERNILRVELDIETARADILQAELEAKVGGSKILQPEFAGNPLSHGELTAEKMKNAQMELCLNWSKEKIEDINMNLEQINNELKPITAGTVKPYEPLNYTMQNNPLMHFLWESEACPVIALVLIFIGLIALVLYCGGVF